MKLDNRELFDEYGKVRITDKGWIGLRHFCESVVYKRVGRKPYTEDLISASLIACIERLPDYNPKKNDKVLGFLYFTVLGVISTSANKAKWETPVNFMRFDEWI